MAEIETPQARKGGVILAIEAVGICGGDLKVFRQGPPQCTGGEPLVVGHEAVGVVTELGLNVEGLAVGDRVVTDSQVGWCGVCEACAEGHREVCRDRVDLGSTSQGACSEFASVPASACYRIEADMGVERAVMVHALASCLHGIDQLSADHSNDYFVVAGAGPIGLLFCQIASNILSSQRVVIIGRSPKRLALARRLGATVAISVDRQSDIVGSIKAATGGHGGHVLIETTGSEAIFDAIPQILSPRGSALIFAAGTMQMDAEAILRREVRVVGSTGATDRMCDAIDLIRSGTIQTDPMVSHRFALRDGQTGFEMAAAPNKSEYVKGLLTQG